MACLDGCVYGLHEYSQLFYWIGPTMGIFIGIGSTLVNVGQCQQAGNEYRQSSMTAAGSSNGNIGGK